MSETVITSFPGTETVMSGGFVETTFFSGLVDRGKAKLLAIAPVPTEGFNIFYLIIIGLIILCLFGGFYYFKKKKALSLEEDFIEKC